jgi:hypothetical protein
MTDDHATYSLATVLSWLPAKPAELPLAANLDYVSYCALDPFFEPPEFLGAPGIDPGCPIILVSAGAAVGKSALAREVAARTGSLYCDLAQINVGAQTFQGLLLTAFGPTNIAAATDHLRSGSMALVLDALDEAQARAGDDNFLAFLQDLVQFAPVNVTSPVLVLLGRVETIDRVSGFLTGVGVGFATIEVDYFAVDASLAFISKYLDAVHENSPERPHRKHPVPFEQAKISLVTFLADAIASAGWDEAVTRSFLGYAPVLQGLAAFLDTDNFYELVNTFVGAAEHRPRSKSGRSPWAVLPVIVDQLLLREQDKLVRAAQANFGDLAVREKFDAWSELYTGEQQIRVVAQYLMGSGEPPKPPCLPTALYGPYREILSWLLPQHPFIGRRGDYANVLFSEYVRACIIAGKGDAGLPWADSPEVAAHFPDRYLPSPLLGHLTLFLQNDEPPGTIEELEACPPQAQPSIPGKYLGVWYESFLAAPQRTPTFLTVLPWGWESSAGVVREPMLGSSYSFRVVMAAVDSPVVFRRRLSNADIDEFKIVLGSGGNTAMLGPDVRLFTWSLLLDCRELRVKPGNGVQIRSDEFEIQGCTAPKLVMHGDGVFECDWPNLAYPWLAHKGDGLRPEEDKARREIQHCLSSLFPQFRSQRYFRSTTQWRKGDHMLASWRPPYYGTLMRRIIRVLVQAGLLSYLGPWLLANEQVFADAGYDLLDLMDRREQRTVGKIVGDVYWMLLTSAYGR